MKAAWIDLETTGLNPKKNGIIQIAGFIEIDTVPVAEFNYNVQPFKGQIINNEAMQITGKNIDELKEYTKPDQVHKSLIDTFKKIVNPYKKSDKMFFLGYNSQFDYNFMRAFWKNNNDGYFASFFFSPPLDVMNLAAFYLTNKRHQLNSFKLTEVAKFLGIKFKEEDAHDGMFDISLTKKVFDKIGGKL